MKIRHLLLLITTFIISACNTPLNTTTTKTPIDFSASTYNSIANQYLSRPTFAELLQKTSGENWINIQMEKYGQNQYGMNFLTISFVQTECKTYIDLIDKYLAWEKVASRDKDIIEKKIGSAKSVIFDIDFNFYSGNSTNHYLGIGGIGGEYQFYTKDDAIKLKELLSNYMAGKITPTDINAKYK